MELGSNFNAYLTDSVFIEFIWCPPGKFLMGTPENSMGKNRVLSTVELPQHMVDIESGFWIGSCPVTQEQWTACMSNTSDLLFRDGKDYPANLISWKSANEFCKKTTEILLKSDQITDRYNVELPTEELWEYACRAGTNTLWYFGDSPEMLTDHAWYKDNSNNNIQPVKQKKPNPWGLYDCYGNVAEWCANEMYIYPSGIDNRRGLHENIEHPIARGGDALSGSNWCHSGERMPVNIDNIYNEYVGIRVICINK
jgi:formylglycine-generating enzyme required for sulfatase activity